MKRLTLNSDLKRIPRARRAAALPGWLVILALAIAFGLAGKIEPCDGHGCPQLEEGK
ncbi:hypothetical protein UFOVP119_65 [uncultured Caudovirales phage]|uniref:Uncharacterized protein n=1 Tax=uncultured Caudovirales phage TaxID=2100421 RepID=A0A6J5L7M2_9CAUD|nr:hypothetical protein UFOVP119_65 [uncultured Caudovirales phage]